MAQYQNFRSAIGGFNREDVVSYISLIHNRHISEVNQLKNQLKLLQEQLDSKSQDTLLQEQLEASQTRCVQLEAELASLREQLPTVHAELEAYRWAEQAERAANARIAKLYETASGILADATVSAEQISEEITKLAGEASDKVAQLQQSVASAKDAFRSASAALYAVRPQEPRG